MLLLIVILNQGKKDSYRVNFIVLTFAPMYSITKV